MPASGLNFYLQDARNNFYGIAPAPIAIDGDLLLGRSQNIHISTNCYYGFHGTKNTEKPNKSSDCEMKELDNAIKISSTPTTAKKRSAGEAGFPQLKRHCQEVQRKNSQSETNETIELETNAEDLLESLYWNTHGGNVFHLIQCL